MKTCERCNQPFDETFGGILPVVVLCGEPVVRGVDRCGACLGKFAFETRFKSPPVVSDWRAKARAEAGRRRSPTLEGE